MPCFKGLAVSIHVGGVPLPEYSIQRNSRQSRITSYIPVPSPKIPVTSTSGIPEQANFAVSITLLVPNQRVPYSIPKPTPEDPYPTGKVVGHFPGTIGDRERHGSVVGPYIPRTGSSNETLAAYIYFDGRPKEEVATLLRRGEETWVNSRWVSAEDGGIAEREFLFREVGLERWLNGLDLVGKDKEKAAKIEKRHRRMERNKIKREDTEGEFGLDMAMDGIKDEDRTTPSDSSDEEPPEAEAAGQIKIALFRVLASGEVKKGEYEPQFNADDEDGEPQDGNAEIEHTTSLAKPKTLDPKTISTQTVTGLDAPESPYATFTFLYRSDKQLRKMGILEPAAAEPTQTAARRKSTDFSKLGPLNKFGTVGFTGYREQPKPKKQTSKSIDDMMGDSDGEDDEEDKRRIQKDDDEGTSTAQNGDDIPALDASKQGELSEGVRKIKLKRTYSTEALEEPRKSPNTSAIEAPLAGPTSISPLNGSLAKTIAAEEGSLNTASPFKKQRSSMDGIDNFTAPPATANGASKPMSKSETIPEASISPAAVPLPGPTQSADNDEDL